MKKSLNFDLDTKKLQELYPNNSYTQAYDDIKRFLTKNGFEHRQGSGYISKEIMKASQIVNIIEELNNQHSWIKDCCKTLDYYDVGERFNALELLENKDSKKKEISKEQEKQTKKPFKLKEKSKSSDIERSR